MPSKRPSSSSSNQRNTNRIAPSSSSNRTHQGKDLFAHRVFFVAIFFCIAFVALGYRAFDLQVRRVEEFGRKIGEAQRRIKRIIARRGTIYDRNYARLALSIDVPSIAVNPRAFRYRIRQLVKINLLAASQIKKKSQKNY